MEEHLYILSVVLIILVCFFLFRYLSNDYLQYKKTNPYLIEHRTTISESNKTINHNTIRRSIDRKNGIEFTYSFWFNIRSVSNNSRHNILIKGDLDDQCPGIYVVKDPIDNTLNLQVDLSVWNFKKDCDKYDNEDECKLNKCKWDDNKCIPYDCTDIPDSNVNGGSKNPNIPLCDDLNYCEIKDNKCENVDKMTCTVKNIPINKWTHLIVMLVGNYLDIYINGFLSDRFEIKGVVKQNSSDLIIGKNGENIESADGEIMRLQYFNHAINSSKINMLVNKTEITRNINEEEENTSTTDYLNRTYWIGENSDDNKKMF